jgi:hypothetical protein
MLLFVLSFIASDYSFDIFKLFLALKSITETIGSKVHLVKYQDKKLYKECTEKNGPFWKV